MTELETLIDLDELREQLIERAAQKAIERWSPPKDEEARTRFNETLGGLVEQLVKDEILTAIQEPIADAITQALDGEFQPTDAYGEPRSGPKKTLREVIAARVEEQIKVPDNRPGYGSQNRDTALSEWLTREVKDKVRSQLWADFGSIADGVMESAASAIKDNLDYIIKHKVKR